MATIKNIPLTEFRKHCPQIMRRVSEFGESFKVTRRGKEMAKVVPLEKKSDKKEKSFYGCMKNTITIAPGVDLTEPLDVEWGYDAENI